MMASLIAQLRQKHKDLVVTQGERLVRGLEQFIARHSSVGDATFFDLHLFPWTTVLEEHWHLIRHELDAVLRDVNAIPNFQDISTDQLSITQDDRWKTFFFYAYGYKAQHNCDRCPHTTRLLEHIPGMKTAFFSILLPHKTIPEHRGPYKGVLRYHLALKVPADAHECGLRVGHQVRHWQEGQGLLFDDTFPHSAWNFTDEIRVVLFLDIVRPMRFPASWLNRAMIQLIAWSPYVQSARERFATWKPPTP